MAGLCKGGNEHPGFLKAVIKNYFQNMRGVIVGERRIKCIRFADDMALLAEEEMVLKDMLLELNDSCVKYGMKINANKTNSMVIGRKIYKINLRILNEAVEQWTDRIGNEAMLERVDEERMMLKLIRKRKRNCLGHWLRRNCLLKYTLEGMIDGRRVRDRRRYQIIDDIKIYGSYEETKRKAEIGKIGEGWICSERPTLGQNTKGNEMMSATSISLRLTLLALLFTTLHGLHVPDRLLYVLRMRRDAVPIASDVDVTSDSRV
ncbi:hypothetical protein ANN_09682 [Periplaneta americana]|uniref:Reverse transcriptase domain-containing protein n=1 Tax=Periplaneta americana TaxID=6978 RepID=A0ABQ8TQL6_PERAM|nr:hypothetical protein ANN_09682 [Periplaneta americana]